MKSDRLILGIESSCDETAAAIVTEHGHVLSNVIHSQVPVHAQFGGVVPELASRNHLTAIVPVIDQALEQAGRTLAQVDAVAVTAGPGLAGCLLVGLQTAKSLAWARGLEIVAVDHIEAHMHAILLTDDRGAGAEVPAFPYLALAVSGGHTSLCRVLGPGRWEVLGQTLDDAAGEAFDKVAKMMGLPYPGGVHIDRLAKQGDGTAVKLPRPLLHRGLDFSFSGLKTAARHHLQDHPEIAADLDGQAAKDFAASVQAAIVEVLVRKSMRAAKHHDLNDVVVAGGVACNSGLRAALQAACEAAGRNAWLTPARYCTDNAAMVAGLGASLLKQGNGLAGPPMMALDIHTTRRPPQVAQ